MTSLASEPRVPSFSACARGVDTRGRWGGTALLLQLRKQQRRVCLGWRGQGRMDGQIGVIKTLNKKQIGETGGRMPCRKHLRMSKQRYVCERATGRLMDDPVYQPEAYKEKQGAGVCRIGRGHGRSDVIDLAGRVSPEDKDGQNNRDVVEEALTDGRREDSREPVNEWRP